VLVLVMLMLEWQDNFVPVRCSVAPVTVFEGAADWWSCDVDVVEINVPP
jgi:hypothetical protein